MSRVSALVVVHNEAAILDACLERLAFADEIVVVLDRCTDESANIAAKYRARAVEGAWPLEGPRRAAGVEACTGPWILEIDADEWVDEPLANAVRAAVEKDDNDFFFVPIKNHIGSRWIEHGWMPELALVSKGLLFRKGHKTWGPQRVLPHADFTGSRGPDFSQGLQHNFVADSQELMRRFNHNTALRAEDMVEHDETARTGNLVRKAVSRFWICYVARKGRKEGRLGLLISILAALYPLVAHLKAEEIRSRQAPR